MNKESMHAPEAAQDAPKTTGRASAIIRFIGQGIYDVLTGKIAASEALHPDFRIADYANPQLTWYQNRTYKRTPPCKIGFPFNELFVLDDCPWIAKFGNNTHTHELPDFRYYFVGFGDPKKKNFGLEEMIQWASAKKIPRVALMKYGTPSMQKSGEIIRMITDENGETI